MTKNLSEHFPTISNKILPWDNFKKWVYSILIVKFDLELGQAIELTYPQHVDLNEKEKMNICFLSFPDSNSALLGDTIYHFRIPSYNSHRKSFSLGSFQKPKLLDIKVNQENILFGYVFFRQSKDVSLTRGYFQKSCLLLTKLPYHNLFYYILNMMAPFYFENGLPALESASNDIDHWPSPKEGIICSLPFMGKIIKCRIPKSGEYCLSSSESFLHEFYQSDPELIVGDGLNSIIIPNLCELDTYGWLYPVISQIHLLWELVITCQPILVIGSSPPICSNVVQVLTNLILPLEYSADYRPYFTIHDIDFKKYTQPMNENQTPPSVILGVTNPFFAKTLQHWPHIIRIHTPKSNKHKKSVKKSTQLQPFDNKTGVYTKYKTLITKDKSFISKLFKDRPNEVKNILIHRYFSELTQSFMIPLERYVASLLPFYDDISPYKNWPEVLPFIKERFLASVKLNGPQLTTHHKGEWEVLYKKFFDTPNFERWYETRVIELCHKVECILAQKVRNVDFHGTYRTKPEMQIVDIIINLKDKLKRYKEIDPTRHHKIIQYLEGQINLLINELPQDLKISINK